MEYFRTSGDRSLGRMINGMGIDYNFTQQPFSAWATVIAMDVWHWTSLVVLLCYAGLMAIPDAYYQAARSMEPQIGRFSVTYSYPK